MKKRQDVAGWFIGIALIFFLLVPVFSVAKGGGGSSGSTSGSSGSSHNRSESVEETSGSGGIYGELYIIDRYRGGEIKRVPAVDEFGEPVFDWKEDWVDPDGNVSSSPVRVQTWTETRAVGGEPRLTENYAVYTVIDEDTNEYVVNPDTGGIYYLAPYPSQCVQPLGDFERWGNLEAKTGLSANRLPLLMTYDIKNERTECEVDPGVFIAAGESYSGMAYYRDIHWPELIQEVELGRLNMGRAPLTVLQRAFDEVIVTINKARDIKLDATGRFVLTIDVYDEFITDEAGDPILLRTEEKVIDSPKENLALYIKLLQDGHLVTPATERHPLDKSKYGGIPLEKKLDREDGPGGHLRPTIDVEKMVQFGFGHLVDPLNLQTYYVQTDSRGNVVFDENGNIIISTTECDGCSQWLGSITSEADDACMGEDFTFAASFLGAAADKKGRITTDKIVYLNSILGINKITGSSVDMMTGEVIDFQKRPLYFDYSIMDEYRRLHLYGHQRGHAIHGNHNGSYDYDGMLTFMENSGAGVWQEATDTINSRIFKNMSNEEDTDIGGFRNMADDALQVVIFTHEYEVPSLE